MPKTNVCAGCGKAIPFNADPVRDECGLTVMTGKMHEPTCEHDEMYQMVDQQIFDGACSLTCFVKVLENRAKLVEKRNTRLCLIFSTTDPKEVLEAIARQLKGRT